MAKAIASRLLHEPTLRMKRSAGSDDAYLYVSALRELFGLDAAETEPEGEAGGKRHRTPPQGLGAVRPQIKDAGRGGFARRATRPLDGSHTAPRYSG